MSSANKPLNSSTLSSQAYLIIREGGRWTDVYRLEPQRKVGIGRSSSSQIVIPDDRASRHHAEIYFQEGSWRVRDLDSRNGTLVDQQPIQGERLLATGQVITVAGCNMQFVNDISTAFSVGPATIGQKRDAESARTEDEHDPNLITHRQSRAELLADTNPSTERAGAVARLAFQVAQCSGLDDAANTVLDAVLKKCGIQSGAILAGQAELLEASRSRAHPGPLQVVAARHQPGRSYHRLPDLLLDAVWQGSEAVLARNLTQDASFSRQDSQGQFSATSTLAAPIRGSQQTFSVIHLYSLTSEPDLRPEYLDFVLAAADLLGAAWEAMGRQAELVKRLERSNRKVELLKAQLEDQHQILGKSPPIEAVRRAITRVAASTATVLIRGESGTGKELVAAAIHESSPRRDGPLVCMNCAALSPMLLESELFGHEKGAFTGATDRKRGKFEAADGGTLMLDEVGEMDPDIQAKFLRVLEGHPFERVGGNQPIRADVRVVAATNRDLEVAVQEGRFRSDLYYRLHVVELELPPLRDRGADVVLLANAFLIRLAQQMGRRIDGFTKEAELKLMGHAWPGNVRELRNVIERAVVLGAGTQIDADDLMLSRFKLEGESGAMEQATVPLISLAELESRHIQRVLEATGGNKSKAASILGIERSTLDRKLKRSP